MKRTEHLEALREADKELDAERDRRYAEVAQERAKALAIKEEADKEALKLAREAQTYKDLKANELREQIASERGSYLTVDSYDERHDELIRRLTFLEKALAEGGGRRAFISSTWGFVAGAVGVAAAIAAIVTNLH